MRRITKAVAAVVFIAATVAVTWAATRFTVRVGSESVMLLTREQAAECDQGAGCEAMSARQVSTIVMTLVQGLAEGRPAAPRAAPDAKRSDI
jgi:hypothetical protein